MRRGFSLVELSIVLVILGLLTGGILAGRSLIRASELRSIGTDFSRFQAATYSFRDRYMGLPGDISNASSFWGAADGADGLGNDCTAATSNGTTTCNGNGNGRWVFTDGSGAGYAPEAFHFWLQLKNAGLIEGNYTGKRTADPREATIGTNIPGSRIVNAGYSVQSNDYLSHPQMYDGHYDGVFFGGFTTGYEGLSFVLTTEETWNIDTKMDDGKPGLGRLRTMWNSSCATPLGYANQLTAVYNLAATGLRCNIFFNLLGDPGM